MAARFVVALSLVLGVLLCLQPLPALSITIYTPQLELGYSPGTLAPISSGVPVYTFGDSMWVATGSQNPYAYQLSAPDGHQVAAGTVEPGAVILLHTFVPGDAPGLWTLEVDVQGSVAGPRTISILLAQASPVSFNMTADSISSAGVFSMNFTAANAPTASGFSSCVFGSSLPEAVSAPVPSSVGKGDMLVTLNGSSVAISPQPLVTQVTTPFNFWVELYQNYSYTEGGVSTMVFRDLQVAASTAVPVSATTTSANAAFTQAVAFRPGLFDLRLFFDSSHGLSVTQASVLITDNSSGWISLQDCSATSVPASNVVTARSTLTDVSGTWPSQAFLMYQEDGVEGYSAAPLPVEVSAMVLGAAPYGAPFNDSELSISPGPGVQNTAPVKGTFFFLASHYPIQVSVSLLDGTPPVHITIPVPYSLMRVLINASKLVVTASVGGQGTSAPGAVVSVSAAGTVIAEGTTNATGKSTFYLPAGSYSVVGTYQNATESAAVSATSGNVLQVALTFPGPPTIYGTLLLVSAAIGAVAALFVWTNVYRGRTEARRMRPTSSGGAANSSFLSTEEF